MNARTPNALTLVNPHDGNLAFKILSFCDNSYFDHLQRLNYFSVILVTKGEGKLRADFSESEFAGESLMCFAPYQPFMIEAKGELEGIVMNFHPDFFCIHKHQKEVACDGVLFNNIYNPPLLALQPEETQSFLGMTAQIRTEMENIELAQYDLLVSYLKIFLITASRIKVRDTDPTADAPAEAKEPPLLQELKTNIESHFRTKHSPAAYADMLAITPKALTRLTKSHFNKTVTDLIAERIIIEAKRELYLTSKPVKTIAYELGYDDEYYFSRFFKNKADISPQVYRDTVGFARAEE